MGFSCFPCCSVPLVPDDHTELSRAELKRLYDRSIALNGGKLYVHGIFARANTRNNNKRVYPKHILEREVSRFESEHILQGTALGELDHPNYASKYFKCLNLPNVSHQVLEVTWKGDQLWGTIEVLPTPSGLLLWELYSRGVKLGVSSRGWASLRSDPASKCVYVDDDFELITFDFVTEPSTRGAYLAPVQRKYKRPVPDQSKVVAIAHLGHGVVALEKVARIPAPAVLVQRIAELQRASAAAMQQLAMPGAPLACGPGVLQQVMPPSFKPNSLDNLLCYGHYVVHQSAPYLDREQHARDYRAHLVIFTARAHLADERLNTGTLSRGDIDNVILNKLVTKDSFDPASTSFATRLDQPSHLGIGISGVTTIVAADGVGVGLVGGSGAGGAAGGVVGIGVVSSNAAAAAAAETQGLPGIDASYAVVHANAAQRANGAAGDLESWAMHPHVLNATLTGSSSDVAGGGRGETRGTAGTTPSQAFLASQPTPAVFQPSGSGQARGNIDYGGNGGGGLKILPVVVGPGGNAVLVKAGSGHHRLGGSGAGDVQLRPGQAGTAGGGGGGLEDEQMRSWLSQLPCGESMAQGFMDIRSTLVSFAQLYQLHQKRVEASLLKQVQVQVGGHYHHHVAQRL